ncbi:MAG TPA: tail fiber domain-containing protein [Candidatus Intestinimonas merdavium]|uniref:Tail fiber domain-containing protein n=1 Tax=Candidatus Intestinimonas merdavium TaxID=2838622 RepID=A0A9D1Z694_9FIRM|nr:tail fiber domain-containing protein [Candidatus Intestinimonas merdavium]
MSDKVYLGGNMAQLDRSPALPPVSRVVLKLDEENGYRSGDGTGRTMEISCPYGTQAMADRILAVLRGCTYTPLQARDALLDPAAELGDGLTAGGIYTVLGQMDLDWDALMAGDVGAPGQTEQESEYQYRSPVIAAIHGQISETRSILAKTAEEIRLEVKNEIEGLSASISVKLDSITSTVQGQGQAISVVEQRVDSITSTVQGQGQAISVVEQKVDSIRLSVSNGADSSTITMTVGDVAVSSQQITFTGVVTFSDLAGSGTTVINGNNVTTGTISANRLDLTGAVTFSDLSSAVRNDINDAYSIASDTQDTVSRWTYGGTTYIDGARIMTGTVSASVLEGGSVNLLNYGGSAVGVLTMTGASSSSYAIDLTSFGALRLTGEAGDVFLKSGNGTYFHVMGDVVIGYANLRSNQSGNYSCGTSIYRWSDVYSDTSVATTSDRKMKTAVTYDMAPYETLFDRLRPTPFRYNNGTSGRTHLGMISQDVEQAMAETGLTGQDFAGFVRGEDEDGGDICLLRYSEFIPLCIDQIQKLKARVAELEGRS